MTNFEIFESLGDFSRALNARPVNALFKRKKTLPSHDTEDDNWYGTPDYQTADKLLLGGDKENAAKIQTALNTRLRLNGGGRAPQNTLYNSVQGFAPNMGRLMSGHPENMLNIRRIMRDSSKVVTVVYNCSCGGIYSAEDKINSGVKALEAVCRLEKAGYRCNLYVGTINNDGHNYHSVFVKIKDSGKMLDITRLAYTFANPSFHRRHMFAWRERAAQYKSIQMGRSVLGGTAVNCLRQNKRFAGAIYIDFDSAREKNFEELIKNRL